MIALLASSTNGNVMRAQCIDVYFSTDAYGVCMQMSFIDVQKVRDMQLEGGLTVDGGLVEGGRYLDKTWRLCMHISLSMYA